MVSGQHRQTIPTNSEYSVPQTRMLLRQVESILGRPDLHETAIVEVLQRVMDLLDPPPQPEPKRRQIGFRVTDDDQAN